MRERERERKRKRKSVCVCVYNDYAVHTSKQRAMDGARAMHSCFEALGKKKKK